MQRFCNFKCQFTIKNRMLLCIVAEQSAFVTTHNFSTLASFGLATKLPKTEKVDGANDAECVSIASVWYRLQLSRTHHPLVMCMSKRVFRKPPSKLMVFRPLFSLTPPHVVRQFFGTHSGYMMFWCPGWTDCCRPLHEVPKRGT